MNITLTNIKYLLVGIAVFLLAAEPLTAQNAIKTHLPPHMRMSLTEYTDTIRIMMANMEWERARKYLDAANTKWGYTSIFQFLNGKYYYHMDQQDEARKFLLNAVKTDETNIEALNLLMKLEQEH